MNFNLDETVNAGARVQFTGNAIYDVTFDGCEARDFDKKDGNGQFHVLEIKFSNKDGYFTHTIWEPREEDAQDRPGAFGNQPSNLKVMNYLLKHLIDTVNPELSAKIDKKEASLSAPNWDAFRKLIVDSTNPGKGTKTKIKLVKNNKGDAAFPYFLNYDRNGKLYMSTNFIGNGVFFTNKELDRIKKSEARPVSVSSNTDTFDIPATTTQSADDFDMNI